MESLNPEMPKTKAAAKMKDPQEIQKLIDGVVSRQSVRSVDPVSPIESLRAALSPQPQDEGKLILLSRTLSGLIDLILIVLCVGIFIISADASAGILVMDSISLIGYAALFLLTYFVYSIFFLASTNQTIGMMITDLRVVGWNQSRPLIGQLFYRCCGYLVSLFGVGIGLLWSLLDRNSLCFHDRISRTKVIRI